MKRMGINLTKHVRNIALSGIQIVLKDIALNVDSELEALFRIIALVFEPDFVSALQQLF